MTLPRKVGLALGLALLTLGAGHVLLLLQGIPGLSWPVLLLRTCLLLLTLPAIALGLWLELHTGLHIPPLLLIGPLFLAYHTLWNGAARLRATLEMPVRPGRRAFLAGTTVAAATGYGVTHAYPAPLVTRQDLPLQDLPPELDRLRVVLLSDLHRGPAIGQEYLEAVIRQVNALRPDLVLLSGDFVSKSSAYFPDLTRVLSGLRPTIASLATLGNHDHWEGTEAARRAITRAGVLLLHNRSVHLGPDRRLSAFGESGLCLAGVDDLGAGEPDLAAALAGVAPRVPRLLLSHNPDFAEEEQAVSSTQRVDLQVSGHTHGGQVILPAAGPVVSGSRFGLKYISGWAQGPRWPVFVTRGVGASILPLRIGSPPEIVLFELSSVTRTANSKT